MGLDKMRNPMLIVEEREGGVCLQPAVALPIAFLLVRSSDYRWQRIIAFTDPFKYRTSGGYQIVESWMSFGAGGLTGVGLVRSGRRRTGYRPWRS